MKLTLDVSYDYQFLLLGIICHSRDYRLGWFLNQKLGMDFERQENLKVFHKRKETQHSCFVYSDAENHVLYHLIQNKSNEGFYLPESKIADYLLKVEDDGNILISELSKNLKSIPIIQTVFEIEVEDLKNKELLIF